MSWRWTRGLAAAAVVGMGVGPAKVAAGDAIEMTFGGSAIVGQALGDFADQVGTPYGLGGHVAWARPGKPFGLRLEVTGLIYGSETRQVPVGQPGLRQSLRWRPRTEWPRWASGPQFVASKARSGPTSRPSRASRTSAPTRRSGPTWTSFPVAQSTNYDDTVFAYGGGLGILIPLGASKSGGLALDVGARFVGGGEVRYLAEGDHHGPPGRRRRLHSAQHQGQPHRVPHRPHRSPLARTIHEGPPDRFVNSPIWPNAASTSLPIR